jgi:hypothetical protein
VGLAAAQEGEGRGERGSGDGAAPILTRRRGGKGGEVPMLGTMWRVGKGRPGTLSAPDSAVRTTAAR